MITFVRRLAFEGGSPSVQGVLGLLLATPLLMAFSQAPDRPKAHASPFLELLRLEGQPRSYFVERTRDAMMCFDPALKLEARGMYIAKVAGDVPFSAPRPGAKTCAFNFLGPNARWQPLSITAQSEVCRVTFSVSGDRIVALNAQVRSGRQVDAEECFYRVYVAALGYNGYFSLPRERLFEPVHRTIFQLDPHLAGPMVATPVIRIRRACNFSGPVPAGLRNTENPEAYCKRS